MGADSVFLQAREQYLFLLVTNPMLQAAISKTAGGSIQTKYRWAAFKNVADPIIDGHMAEPRFFDYALRRELFDKSQECKICGSQIHLFDDSTVDHIHPYSKGGKTVRENGQLAHRSCNARKNMSLPENATVSS
jgi:5-methylcytosine-specific restriction endonuclease McrA